MDQQQAAAPSRLPADLLAFDPVPLRGRRDGWTIERQRRYVRALAATGHAGRAAALAGMSPQSACALRRRPGAGSFACACAAAWFLAAERPRAGARGPDAETPMATATFRTL